MTKTSEKQASERARELALVFADTLDGKKADDIEILDLRGLSILADYFVIGAGYAQVQVKALADFVLEAGREADAKRISTEGYQESRWILIDYGDVVVHLMTHESRDYYRLGRLWGDAPRLQWEAKVNNSDPNPSTDEMEKE